MSNVRGGYDSCTAGSKYKSDAYEFGVSTSFSFPRLLTPFRVNRYNHALNPRTRIDLSYNTQKRPYYHRDLASAVWGYSWGKGRSTFALRPVDLTLVNMRYVQDSFLKNLVNPYLQNSYTSQLIAGLSGSYLYTNQQKNANRGSIALRFNFETNGNLLNALYRIGFPNKEKDEYYTLLGIRYAQYFRTDLSFVKNFWLGQKSALVYRFFGGFAMRTATLPHCRSNGFSIAAAATACADGRPGRSGRHRRTHRLRLPEPTGQHASGDEPGSPFPSMGFPARRCFLRRGQYLVRRTRYHPGKPVSTPQFLQTRRTEHRNRRPGSTSISLFSASTGVFNCTIRTSIPENAGSSAISA